MKKLTLMMLISLISVFCYAEEWQGYWIKAVEACEEKNYEEAGHLFDLAIETVENAGISDVPHLYVDRARLNLLLNRVELSLPDLDKALSNEKIDYQETLRALLSRFLARARLGMEQGALDDLKRFGDLKVDKPLMEMIKNKIIIRNIPDSDCYSKIMTCYFIHSGMCKSKNDIKMLKSGICLIDRADDSDCESCVEGDTEDRVCDACGFVIKPISENCLTVEGCKGWCDRTAVLGGSWCGKVFSRLRCQALCALAVYELQQGCYWCCEGGGFYKRCIKPFEDILAQIGEGCDPAWD